MSANDVLTVLASGAVLLLVLFSAMLLVAALVDAFMGDE